MAVCKSKGTLIKGWDGPASTSGLVRGRHPSFNQAARTIGSVPMGHRNEPTKPRWYVTGGVAFTNITSTLQAFDGAITVSGRRTGFIYGGGIEDKISKNWSLRLEVLFADFGRRNGLTVIDSKGSPQTFRASFKDSIGIIRSGVNVQW